MPPRVSRAFALTVLLACAASPHVQGFGRLNIVSRRAPVPIPFQAPGARREGNVWALSAAVHGQSILVATGGVVVHQVKAGQTDWFAGDGTYGTLLIPGSPRGSQIRSSGNLLRLRDGSVLIREMVDSILQIRPKGAADGPRVSVFATAGAGDRVGGVNLGPLLEGGMSALGAMVELRDGSVLLAEPISAKVLRVHDGVAEVFAGMGPAPANAGAAQFDPLDPLNTRLDAISGLAVLADDSVLIADSGHERILRIRQGAVSIFAGQAGADCQVDLHGPTALVAMPDHSVLVVQRSGTELLRLVPGNGGAPGSATLYFGPDRGEYPLDAGYAKDPYQYHWQPDGQGAMELANQGNDGIQSLTALRDGSVLIAGGRRGLLLLSPADPIQQLLEATVARGKAAIRKGNREAYELAKRDLAYLSAPITDALRATHKAAFHWGGMAPATIPARLHLIKDVMGIISKQAETGPVERLRAQLALKELRKFKRGSVP